jgi:protein-S-isoprenylcysteine O-methyltransferase Ste14
MNVQWQSVARRIRVPMGFLFAALFLLLARPSLHSLLLSQVLVVPGLLLRGYASGYVKKNAELTVGGPYAFTRNPLYLGSMMIAFGFALASRSPTIAITLAVFFVLIYIPVIRSEEEFLRSKFPEFLAYAHDVPRLLPRFTPAAFSRGADRFSMELYYQHREYNALIGAISIYALLTLRMYLHLRK